jgi:glycosyltransferase involved in cell wall biosynthesis
MPRKFANDATQIINILKAWGAVKDFKLVEIDNMEEKKVAEILRESLIFLSLSHREGFGMPSAEAMACGCIVIGYDGKGGREFFKEEFCYPVEQDNLIGFAQTVKKVIEEYEMNKEIFLEKGRMASEFILTAYSLKREEEDVVRVWQEILKG